MDNITLDDTERLLRKACAVRGFSYHLNYSEAENTFYADASGIGIGEYCEVKRARSLGQAMDRLTARVEAAFPLATTAA